MRSVIDYEGADETHGYTVDADGNRWFWSVPNTGTTVTFREHGYHTDHPYRKTGAVPEAVRDHAQTTIDAMLEQTDSPQY